MTIVEIFSYGFMQRALISGLLVGILCAVLGVFLVLRRLSLIGDGLAHVTFGSVALALALKAQPLYVTLAALPLVLLSSLGILKLTEKAKIYGDAAIGIVSAAGIAVGVILAGATGGFNVDLFSYLFGNILAVSIEETVMAGVLFCLVIAVVIVHYRKLFAIPCHEAGRDTAGLRSADHPSGHRPAGRPELSPDHCHVGAILGIIGSYGNTPVTRAQPADRRGHRADQYPAVHDCFCRQKIFPANWKLVVESATVRAASHCNASASASTAVYSAAVKIGGNVDCGNIWPWALAVFVRCGPHRHEFKSLIRNTLDASGKLDSDLMPAERSDDVVAAHKPPHLRYQLPGDQHPFSGPFTLFLTFHSHSDRFRYGYSRYFVVEILAVPLTDQRHDPEEDRNADVGRLLHHCLCYL